MIPREGNQTETYPKDKEDDLWCSVSPVKIGIHLDNAGGEKLNEIPVSPSRFSILAKSTEEETNEAEDKWEKGKIQNSMRNARGVGNSPTLNSSIKKAK